MKTYRFDLFSHIHFDLLERSMISKVVRYGKRSMFCFHKVKKTNSSLAATLSHSSHTNYNPLSYSPILYYCYCYYYYNRLILRHHTHGQGKLPMLTTFKRTGLGEFFVHFFYNHSLPAGRSIDSRSHAPAKKITTVAHPEPHRISRDERRKNFSRWLSCRVPG